LDQDGGEGSWRDPPDPRRRTQRRRTTGSKPLDHLIGKSRHPGIVKGFWDADNFIGAKPLYFCLLPNEVRSIAMILDGLLRDGRRIVSQIGGKSEKRLAGHLWEAKPFCEGSKNSVVAHADARLVELRSALAIAEPVLDAS
jgi:hypothetical protein